MLAVADNKLGNLDDNWPGQFEAGGSVVGQLPSDGLAAEEGKEWVRSGGASDFNWGVGGGLVHLSLHD